jgi:YlmC/YmxH family sporulation protein
MGKKLSEIAGVEIINVFDGGKYGYLGDSEMLFDKETGKIISILVNGGRGSIFSFTNQDKVEIKWEDKMKLCEKTLIFDSKL